MSKFKVGDKVKIIAANHWQDKKLVGMYTVVEVVMPNNQICRIDGNDFWWHFDELELVEERPGHKFKVGDKVRVSKLRPRSMRRKEQFVGRTFTVRAVTPGSKYPYAFVEPNGYFWCDDELELVPEIKEHTIVLNVQLTVISQEEPKHLRPIDDIKRDALSLLKERMWEFDDVLITDLKIFERDLV